MPCVLAVQCSLPAVAYCLCSLLTQSTPVCARDVFCLVTVLAAYSHHRLRCSRCSQDGLGYILHNSVPCSLPCIGTTSCNSWTYHHAACSHTNRSVSITSVVPKTARPWHGEHTACTLFLSPSLHTLLITCTCCYDQIKGTLDKDFSYSFSDSAMMRSKELTTSRSILMPILWFSLYSASTIL